MAEKPTYEEVERALAKEAERRKKAEMALEESEDRFRNLFEYSAVGIAIVDVDGNFLSVNKAACRILRFSEEEMLKLTFLDITHSDDLERSANRFAQCIEDKEAYIIEKRYNGKDGKSVWGETTVSPVFDTDNQLLYAIAVLQDVTSRKRAEERHRFYGNLLSVVDEAVIVTDAEGKVTFWNDCAERLYGWDQSEAMGRNVHELTVPEVADAHADEIMSRLTSGKSWSGEFLVQRKDGTVFPAIVTDTPITAEDGSIVGIIGLSQDITERKQTEKELWESRQRMELALRGADLGTWDATLPSGVKTYDDRYAEMLGYTLDELAAMERFEEEVHPDDEPRVSEAWDAHASGKTDAYEVEYRIRHKSGHWVWVLCRGRIVEHDDGGTPRHASGTHLDITERKQAEERLESLERRNQALLDYSPVCHKIVDLDFNLQYMSANGFKMLNLDHNSEVYGKPYPFDFFPEAFRKEMTENLRKVRDTGEAITMEALANDSEGNEVWLESALIPVFGKDEGIDYLTVVSANVTDRINDESERRRLESQLQQAHKMEAIGTLAGGVAHDFNNILGIILGNTELAIDDVPDWNPAKECLREIRSATLRGRDVVRQILSFSRHTLFERNPMRLTPVVEETLRLLRATIPTSIDIRKNLNAGLDTILADQAQVSQILMNLCTNAHHAMGDGGSLVVGLSNIAIDEGSDATAPNLPPGDYVCLTVTDSGQGIEPEDMDRIFDPYFTTKKVGEGTGMGLAVVRGIVTNAGGAITVDSEVGKGTTFRVCLPLADETLVQELKESEHLPTGSERIILVDDEKSLVRAYSATISSLGYDVVPCTSSRKALEIFQKESDKIDLVITDMTMPEMTGEVLTQELQKIRPDVPIIICTGHSERIAEESAKALGIAGYAVKPIVKQDIAVAIRKALDG